MGILGKLGMKIPSIIGEYQILASLQYVKKSYFGHGNKHQQKIPDNMGLKASNYQQKAYIMCCC